MAKRKKRRKERLVSQVERLQRFSEKPDSVDHNHPSWPVSVKTGRVACACRDWSSRHVARLRQCSCTASSRCVY